MAYSYVVALVTLAGCGGRTSILDDDALGRDGVQDGDGIGEQGGGASVSVGTTSRGGSAGNGVVDSSPTLMPLTTPSWALGVAACPAKGNGLTGAGCDQRFMCSSGTFTINCKAQDTASGDITCACVNPAGGSVSGFFGPSPTLCFDAGSLCVQ